MASIPRSLVCVPSCHIFPIILLPPFNPSSRRGKKYYPMPLYPTLVAPACLFLPFSSPIPIHTRLFTTTCIPSSFLSAFYLTAPTDHDCYLQNISTFRRLGPNGPPNSAISFASSPFTLKWNLLLMRLQVRTMPDMAITWLRLRGLTGSKFRCNDKQLFRSGVDGG